MMGMGWKNAYATFVDCTCLECGSLFSSTPSEIKRGGGKYCTTDCYKASRVGIGLIRFWEKVDKSNPDGCWPWTGSRDGGNYGQVRVNYKNRKATHIALELSDRPVPDGLHALHLCDNPPCVRPDHLVIGTRLENMADMVTKRRDVGARFPDDCRERGKRNIHHLTDNPRRGENHPRSKLSDAQANEIRTLRHLGMPLRPLAIRFGVSQTTICAIARAKSRTPITE